MRTAVPFLIWQIRFSASDFPRFAFVSVLHDFLFHHLPCPGLPRSIVCRHQQASFIGNISARDFCRTQRKETLGATSLKRILRCGLFPVQDNEICFLHERSAAADSLIVLKEISAKRAGVIPQNKASAQTHHLCAKYAGFPLALPVIWLYNKMID